MGTAIEWLTGKALFGRQITEPVARWIASFALFIAIMVLIAATLAVTRCSSSKQQKAQAEVHQGQQSAFTNSAADAIATQQSASAREQASEAVSRSNEEEIRNAKGATAPVDPAVRDAGLRSLCRRAAYRDSARCKLLDAPAR